MTNLTLSVAEVQSILETLDVNKATGPVEIQAKLLKAEPLLLASSLCKIFNKSLRLGILLNE